MAKLGTQLYLHDDSRDLYEEIVPYLLINPDNITGELVTHSANYVFLAAHHSVAKHDKELAKVTLDQCRAQVFISSKLSSVDGPKGKTTVTELMARAYVDSSADIVQLKQALAWCDQRLAMWENVMVAMEQKSYMLTKLADMDIVERRLAADTYNGGTSGVAESMNSMANIGYKQRTNLEKRKARLDSIRKPKEVSPDDVDGYS